MQRLSERGRGYKPKAVAGISDFCNRFCRYQRPNSMTFRRFTLGCPRLARLGAFLCLLAACSADAQQPRSADTNDIQLWLTNTFRPWLIRSYPEVTTKFYPDWFHDHPLGVRPN